MAQKDITNPHSHAEYSSKEKPTVTRKTFLITILIALLLIAVLWIWKSLAMSSQNKQAEARQHELKQQSQQMIIKTHQEHLKLLAKPFVWAIRSEMMKGNNSQINLYMNDMVKEKNFERIIVINGKGTILASTNKKDEGKSFTTVGDASKLDTGDTNIENQGDSLLTMFSPVMGFNNRLGTLYVQYKVTAPLK